MAARRSAAYRRADLAAGGAVLVAVLGACIPFAADAVGSIARAPEVAAPAKNIAPPPAERAALHFAAERTCLTQAMYFEARGEGEYGQRAVAEVVLERTRSKYYPDTVCGVVYEGQDQGRKCQFSFVCDGSLEREIRPAMWERTERLASQILTGAVKLRGDTGRAIAYHAVSVEPEWAQGMLRTVQIGNHIFYRPFPAGMLRPAEQPHSAVLLTGGGIEPVSVSAEDVSIEIESDIQIDGAVGDGT